MGKILIISNGFPNYGGQSTTAYNLLKLLKGRKHDARLVCITIIKNADPDPDTTGAAYKIILRKNFIRTIFYFFNRKNKLLFNNYINLLKKYYFTLRLLPRLLNVLVSKKFNPDLVITNVPAYAWMIKRVFRKKKILVVIGSSPEMSELSKLGIDTSSVIAKPEIAFNTLKKINNYDFSRVNILFNSHLTKKIYDLLNIRYEKAFVQYFNITPQEQGNKVDFHLREYDIAFVVSDFDRSVKNIGLASKIFKLFGTNKKIAIGKGSEVFSDIENTTTVKSTSQKTVLDFLCNTKLLIITSYFDSSPGIISEAIIHGCNILVSQNVGWSEVMDDRCVIREYNNLDEWQKKTEYLLSHPIDYTPFIEVIMNSKNAIIECIEKIF